MLRKPFDKTSTYRKANETEHIINEPITTAAHERLYYTRTVRRWKNKANNTESDTKANLDTYRYPVISAIQIEFTAHRQKEEGRNK